MKLYAPTYYKDFSCIADRCKHSCCIDWEIDIDDASFSKYQSLQSEYGQKIRESIHLDSSPSFCLLPNGKCPHLSKEGLCRIIMEEGEDLLCDICREHPRFYNRTYYGTEVGLGMVCEEACRIILHSDEYQCMLEIEQTTNPGDAPEFDTIPLRKAIYSILSDHSLPYGTRLARLQLFQSIAPTARSDEDWRALLSSLEYLDSSHRERFLCYSSDSESHPSSESFLERALAYFIYRHCTPACSESDFRARLGFSLFCERLLSSLIKSDPHFSEEQAMEHARIISEEIEYSEENTEALITEFMFV